jgi:predicted RNA-binding protein with PUA domain
MKIVICASMSFAEKIFEAEKKLKDDGHEVFVHKNVEKHLEKELSSSENIQDKMEGDVIRVYFEKIKNADAILVLNYDKKGIANYIGGNVFLEIGFAHVLDKKIFLLNEIPEVSYKDEVVAMQPIVLNGDLNKII